MKNLIILAGALLLTACAWWPEYEGYARPDAPPPPSKSVERVYDRDGNLVGTIDNDDRIYDKDGNLIGRKTQ